MCFLHHSCYALQLGLNVFGGYSGDFDAGDDVASFVGGAAVAAAGEKVGYDFGGLEGVGSRLQQLAAEGDEVLRTKLLNAVRDVLRIVHSVRGFHVSGPFA